MSEDTFPNSENFAVLAAYIAYRFTMASAIATSDHRDNDAEFSQRLDRFGQAYAKVLSTLRKPADSGTK